MNFDPAFLDYLKAAAGESNVPAVISALSEPASVSVRLNPFKLRPDEAGGLFGGKGEEVPWNEYALFLPERPQFTLDPLMHAGVYYVQDSSAMFPGFVFRSAVRTLLSENPSSGIRALDQCAAPGGKTTDIATSLRALCGDDFLLVSNEIMKQRAAVLADNAGIWGEPSMAVTSADPAAFAGLAGFFDIIVADVPCSGEGMFRKDGEAAAQWSVVNVELCQARQRRIVADVWPALAEGGFLVYSTCTFNNKENDDNVRWIMENLGAEVVGIDFQSAGIMSSEYGKVLIPGLVKGEGQYCALLRKTVSSNGRSPERNQCSRNHKPDSVRSSGGISKELKNRLSGLFDRDVELLEKNGMLLAVPEFLYRHLPDIESLRPMMRGTAIGQLKGRDMVPDADLALSIILAENAFPKAELSLQEARAFLHRDVVMLPDAPKGIVCVTYLGHPLGFVKNLGSRCNSLHPQHRRIRMDI
ncbi:MAG: rRNA cytosine-C5-methyltransferase [Candidatus Cryptobacteroides sp.]